MKAAQKVVKSRAAVKKWRQKITHKKENDNQDDANPEPVATKNEASESDNEENSIQFDFGEQSKSYYKQILYQALDKDPDAQLIMGKFYLSGKYVKKNLFTGVEWLIKASEECNKDATIILSECLRRNKGITAENRAKVIWCVNTSDRIKKQKSQEKRLLYRLKHAKKMADDDEIALAISSSINQSKISRSTPSGEILSLKEIADAYKSARSTSTSPNRLQPINTNSHITNPTQSPSSTHVTDDKSSQESIENQHHSTSNETSPSQHNPFLRIHEIETSSNHDDNTLQQGGNPFEGLDDDIDDDDSNDIPGNPFLDTNDDNEDMPINPGDEQDDEKTKDSVFNRSTAALLETDDLNDFLYVAFGSDDEDASLPDTSEYQPSANKMSSRVANKVSSVVSKLRQNKKQLSRSSMNVSTTPLSSRASSRNASTASIEWTSTLHQHSHPGPADTNIDSPSNLSQQSLDTLSEKLSNSAHDLSHIELPQVRERGQSLSNLEKPKFRRSIASSALQNQAIIGSNISITHSDYSNDVDDHQRVDHKLGNPFEVQPRNPFETETENPTEAEPKDSPNTQPGNPFETETENPTEVEPEDSPNTQSGNPFETPSRNPFETQPGNPFESDLSHSQPDNETVTNVNQNDSPDQSQQYDHQNDHGHQPSILTTSNHLLKSCSTENVENLHQSDSNSEMVQPQDDNEKYKTENAPSDQVTSATDGKDMEKTPDNHFIKSLYQSKVKSSIKSKRAGQRGKLNRKDLDTIHKLSNKRQDTVEFESEDFICVDLVAGMNETKDNNNKKEEDTETQALSVGHSQASIAESLAECTSVDSGMETQHQTGDDLDHDHTDRRHSTEAKTPESNQELTEKSEQATHVDNQQDQLEPTMDQAKEEQHVLSHDEIPSAVVKTHQQVDEVNQLQSKVDHEPVNSISSQSNDPKSSSASSSLPGVDSTSCHADDDTNSTSNIIQPDEVFIDDKSNTTLIGNKEEKPQHTDNEEDNIKDKTYRRKITESDFQIIDDAEFFAEDTWADQRRGSFVLDKLMMKKRLRVNKEKKDATPHNDPNPTPKTNTISRPLRGKLRRNSSVSSLPVSEVHNEQTHTGNIKSTDTIKKSNSTSFSTTENTTVDDEKSITSQQQQHVTTEGSQGDEIPPTPVAVHQSNGDGDIKTPMNNEEMIKMRLDKIAIRKRFPDFKSRLKGVITKGSHNDQQKLIIKPNNQGKRKFVTRRIIKLPVESIAEHIAESDLENTDNKSSHDHPDAIKTDTTEYQQELKRKIFRETSSFLTFASFDVADGGVNEELDDDPSANGNTSLNRSSRYLVFTQEVDDDEEDDNDYSSDDYVDEEYEDDNEDDSRRYLTIATQDNDDNSTTSDDISSCISDASARATDQDHHQHSDQPAPSLDPIKSQSECNHISSTDDQQSDGNPINNKPDADQVDSHDGENDGLKTPVHMENLDDDEGHQPGNTNVIKSALSRTAARRRFTVLKSKLKQIININEGNKLNLNPIHTSQESIYNGMLDQMTSSDNSPRLRRKQYASSRGESKESNSSGDKNDDELYYNSKSWKHMTRDLSESFDYIDYNDSNYDSNKIDQNDNASPLHDINEIESLQDQQAQISDNDQQTRESDGNDDPLDKENMGENDQDQKSQRNSTSSNKSSHKKKRNSESRKHIDINSEAFSFNECLQHAEDGQQHAQLAIGKCYLQGIHIDKDPAQGVNWLIRSSEQCNKEATSLLAQCQRDRIGITSQNKAEVIWCVISTNREKKSRMAIAKMYLKMKSASRPESIVVAHDDDDQNNDKFIAQLAENNCDTSLNSTPIYQSDVPQNPKKALILSQFIQSTASSGIKQSTSQDSIKDDDHLTTTNNTSNGPSSQVSVNDPNPEPLQHEEEEDSPIQEHQPSSRLASIVLQAVGQKLNDTNPSQTQAFSKTGILNKFVQENRDYHQNDHHPTLSPPTTGQILRNLLQPEGNPMSNDVTPKIGKKTSKEIFKEELQKARDGDADAQLQISNYYFEGFGVKRSRKEALQWLKLSSDSGNTQATEMLQDYEDENHKIQVRRKASIRWQSAMGKALERYVQSKQDENESMLIGSQNLKSNIATPSTHHPPTTLHKLIQSVQRESSAANSAHDSSTPSPLDEATNIGSQTESVSNTDVGKSLNEEENTSSEVIQKKNQPEENEESKTDNKSDDDFDAEWEEIAKLPPWEKVKATSKKILVDYPKRTLLATEDFIVGKASQHSEEFFQSLLPTEQLQTLVLLFIYTNCTSALLFTIVPPLFFLIGFMILVVCTLMIFKQRQTIHNGKLWTKLFNQSQRQPDQQVINQDSEQFILRPYLIYFTVLLNTLIFFALSNKSWLPCPELALMSMCIVVSGFALLSSQNDIALMAVMMRIVSAFLANADSIPTWLPFRWLLTLFATNFLSTEIVGGLHLNFSLASCVHLIFPGLMVTMASRYKWQGTYHILIPHLTFIAWWQLMIELFRYSTWSGLLRGSIGWLVAFSLLGMLFGMIIRLLFRCGIVDRLFRVVATAAVPKTLIDQGLIHDDDDNSDERSNPSSTLSTKHDHNKMRMSRKTLFYVILSLLILFFIISNIPSANKDSKITWSQYVAHCGPPAWRASNKANVQVRCRQLADQTVSWSGEIDGIDVVNIDNKFQDMFSGLPWLIHQWLTCVFGRKYTPCDNPDDPICRLRRQHGCHLHNNDHYKFQIRTKMPITQRGNELDILLEAEHDFATQIYQLRQGMLADFTATLKENLGSDTPVLELISINSEGLRKQSIYQDNATLMVFHFLLQFIFYPMLTMSE